MQWSDGDAMTYTRACVGDAESDAHRMVRWLVRSHRSTYVIYHIRTPTLHSSCEKYECDAKRIRDLSRSRAQQRATVTRWPVASAWPGRPVPSRVGVMPCPSTLCSVYCTINQRLLIRGPDRPPYYTTVAYGRSQRTTLSHPYVFPSLFRVLYLGPGLCYVHSLGVLMNYL